MSDIDLRSQDVSNLCDQKFSQVFSIKEYARLSGTVQIQDLQRHFVVCVSVDTKGGGHILRP